MAGRITGGTGRIGANVVKRLAERGDALRCVVRPGTDRLEKLTPFDVEIIGLRMPRVREGTSGPSGDWLVVLAYLPGSTAGFLLGVSNRLGAGEIVVSRPESGQAVVHVLSQVFG